jgi:uncharacterized flavoprotein (TIGR03862 family)
MNQPEDLEAVTDAIPDVIVIGAGPAGLAAAEVAAAAGARVRILEAMPSAGRKFLMAGRGGLNLTHSEALEPFLARYAGDPLAARAVAGFPPGALIDWVQGLGIDTFTGSSRRVFPVGLKASPLLRAWLSRLQAAGVQLLLRHRVSGVRAGSDGAAVVEGSRPDGAFAFAAGAVVLALGGASWSRLGADGRWADWLGDRGVPLEPFVPVNGGVTCTWPGDLAERIAGLPLKPVVMQVANAPSGLDAGPLRGECIVTRGGLEGGLIYALGRALRAALAAKGHARLLLDLAPDVDTGTLARRLEAVPASRSFSERLRRGARLSGGRLLLASRVLPQPFRHDPLQTAQALKALAIDVTGLAPIDAAISTGGGVSAAAHDADGMLHALPGVYCAGEMLDWEAPTGGYLLSACIATGRLVGAAAAGRAGCRSSLSPTGCL